MADTDQLSPEVAAELRGLIDAVRGDPPGRPDPAARDAMTYTIVVEHGPEPTTLTASDTAMTKSFADLLDWVERNAA
nr:protealysin inhibitor emfourin [Actinoplanes awajinensis]